MQAVSLPRALCYNAHTMSANPPQDAAPKEISLADAIRFAQHLQRAEKLDDAEAIYQQILKVLPDEPNALHFLGLLRHQQGRNDEALALIHRACALLPGESGPWLNLGNVLLEMDRMDDAVDAFKQAADYAPDNPTIYTNLGVLYARRRHFDNAERAYRHAMGLAKDSSATLMHNYAMMLQRQGRYEECVAYSLKSRELYPDDPKTQRMLAVSYALLGDMENARSVARQWHDRAPDHPESQHLLASMGAAPLPARASDAYIVAEFDSFSKSFDAKLEALEYRAPEFVANALARAIAPATLAGDILDAGCGTGLCAPRLAPMAARLDGIDLSPGMLEKAHSRGGYDSLIQGELTAFIAAHHARWDAIVSADTLCYFGDLTPVCAAAHGALRAKGLLIFSVEALDSTDAAYRMNISGRYIHSRAYLEKALCQAGFDIPHLEQVVLRTEFLRPVQGWVVTARRAP